MARSARYLFVAALAAGFLCLGQVAHAAQASQAPAQTSPTPETAPAKNDLPHGPMPAELTKALDSKKLKEGDPVTARVTAELHMGSGGVIPRGSTLIGHVTEAKARSKGDSQATLGIAFDKIVAGGKEMAVKSVLQAVGPSLSSSAAAAPTGSIGPGMMAGREGAQGAGTTPPPMPTANQTPPPSLPVLTGQSKGVVGIKNLQLGENSVLTSSGKEVKLDSGTQMIVAVEIQVPIE